jgi:hypothetical protein
MDPECPYPDSQYLAVGLYLYQLNPVYPVHRIHVNSLHSTNRELSSFNSYRFVFSLQNLNAFITIQMSATFPTLLIWLYEGITQIQQHILI